MTEVQLGRAVEPESLLSSRATEVIHEFFHWKIDWPFRRPEASAKGSGVYHTSQEKNFSEIQHDARDDLPLVNLIFRCLHSEFRSDSEREIAEQMVDQLFSHLANLA